MTARMRLRAGLTLLELVVVLVILVALAALVIPTVSDMSADVRGTTTAATMTQLQDVIVNRYWHEMDGALPGNLGGYPRPVPADPARANHPQLAFLFMIPQYGAVNPVYNPVSRIGWNGPYILHQGGQYAINAAAGFTADYGLTGDPAVMDGWGRPIVIQRPTVGNANNRNLYTRLISAGPDGVISTPANTLQLTHNPNVTGDDVVLFLRAGDGWAN